MKIATDIYTFSELRGLGFHYVDKTAGILSLVNASIGKQFFCARPRRKRRLGSHSQVHYQLTGLADGVGGWLT